MHWYPYKPQPVELSGHKNGRFATVVNPEGFLQYADGAQIDLHKILTSDKSSVSLMPIHTNIMKNSGLLHGGMVVVDRAIKPKRGDIVVVRYNDAVVIRRLEKSITHWALVADDPREPKLLLGEFADYQLIGVVTYTINSHR